MFKGVSLILARSRITWNTFTNVHTSRISWYHLGLGFLWGSARFPFRGFCISPEHTAKWKSSIPQSWVPDCWNWVPVGIQAGACCICLFTEPLLPQKLLFVSRLHVCAHAHTHPPSHLPKSLMPWIVCLLLVWKNGGADVGWESRLVAVEWEAQCAPNRHQVPFSSDLVDTA